MRRSGITQALIDDDLWIRIEPLLPKRRGRNRRYACLILVEKVLGEHSHFGQMRVVTFSACEEGP